METTRTNRIVGRIVLFLSLVALITVIFGYTQPPLPDEGTLAHIFQLAVLALVPLVALYLATADWGQPMRSARPLAIPSVTLALAFGALYYLEHFFYPAHYR